MPSRRTLMAWAAGGTVLAAAVALAGPGALDNRSDPAARVFADPRAAELARAIAAGQEARVRQLVQAGASLSAQGQAQVTLLQWAMLRDQARMVALLLDLGADPAQQGLNRQSALHTAAMARDRPFLRTLLDHGANPDLTDGQIGAPVLSEAIMNRNHEAVRLLLTHRANPNLTNVQGETPLHTAALINNYTSMLALLEAGADPRLRDHLGQTFATYFAIQPKASMQSGEARRARQAVRDWMQRHGHAALPP